MGWSCDANVGDTLALWSDLCAEQNGTSNCYTGTDGEKYFYQLSRVEHDDGHAGGVTWRELPDGKARKMGRFYIQPNGDASRFPTAWPFDKLRGNNCPRCGAATVRDDRYCGACGCRTLG